MHRIWKALRDRRGFTLIEIAIVIAIIGILLLIALPLFSGARVRAYVAEARQLTSEWKSLAWACLIEKGFNESKCDSNTEIGWTLPANSDSWQWSTTVFACANTATILATVGPSVCTGNETGDDAYVAVRIPRQTGVGLDDDYVLALRSNTGKVQESPANGEDIETP